MFHKNTENSFEEELILFLFRHTQAPSMRCFLERNHNKVRRHVITCYFFSTQPVVVNVVLLFTISFSILKRLSYNIDTLGEKCILIEEK